MNKLGRILVLDGNERSALAITRCLGQHGLRPVVGAETNRSLAGTSRFCGTQVRYASPYQTPMAFIDDLQRIVTEQAIEIILPATDVTTLLATRHQDKWPGVQLPIASYEQLDFLSNKYALFKLAEEVKVPIPETHYIDDAKQALDLADKLTYPVVLKPFRSRILRENDWLVTAVRVAKDATSYQRLVKSYSEYRDYPFLVQQFISGEGAGYFVLYDDNTLIADFCHLRLREKPPSGGVSVLSESSVVDIRLREYAERIFHKTGWHGVAMVEFKLGEDGTPYLMEINTRFWGSLQLAIDSGLEFPYLLYRIASGEELHYPMPYKNGVRLRWLLGDLDRLYIVLKSADYTPSEKFYEILSFLNFFSRNTRHEVNRLEDIKPFLYELRKYILDIVV